MLHILHAGALSGPRVAGDVRAVEFGHGGIEYAVLSWPVAPEPGIEALTPAERAVLDLIVRGLANAEIGRLLGTSPRTVANQVASILAKLRASSRYELAARFGTRS
jgi:DNA-binding NarL/FixJ family response regulator